MVSTSALCVFSRVGPKQVTTIAGRQPRELELLPGTNRYYHCGHPALERTESRRTNNETEASCNTEDKAGHHVHLEIHGPQPGSSQLKLTCHDCEGKIAESLFPPRWYVRCRHDTEQAPVLTNVVHADQEQMQARSMWLDCDVTTGEDCS